MDIKDLTPEQIEKAKACKSSEDLIALAKSENLIALAKSEGVELTDEQLEAVAGGSHTMWDVFMPEDCSNHEVQWGS